MTIERMVEDTSGVLLHLRVKQAHLVGHSLGGMVAIGMAIRHLDQVRSVTGLSTMFVLEGMQPELVKMQRDPTHQPSPALMRLLPTEAEFGEWLASFKRNAPEPEAFERISGRLNAMLADWKGYTPADLRAIHAPVLLVVGDNDFIRVEHAAEMARLLIDAQLAVLPGTTHQGILKRGDWVVSLMDARMAKAAQ